MKARTFLIALLVALALLLYFSGTLAVLATDWKWFDSVGYTSVFETVIFARIGLTVVVGLVAFALLQGNAVLALRQTRPQRLRLSQELAASPIGRWLQNTSGTRFATAGSAVLAFLVGLGASSFWEEFLLFLHRTPFGFRDPILDLDASFYVFVLPLLYFLRNTLLALTVLATILTAIVYATRGAIRIDVVEFKGQTTAQGVEVTPAARRHLAGLVASWMVLIAAGALLQRYALLYDQSGLISGPTRSEVAFGMPLLLVQAVATAIGAVLVGIGVSRLAHRFWIGGAALAILAAVTAATVPNAYHRLVVLPNELSQERPYIEHHVGATRIAYGIEDVGERPLSGEATLTWQDIEDNQGTIQNIRLWDHGPLLDTFSQVQEIRTYYEFPAVDNDRYMVDGELRQTMLSPRELQPGSLPERARTFVNETMVYTHGYGVALGPVNEVTPEGLPHLWVQDLPPQVRYPDPFAIEQPAIYYGESMVQPIFVHTGNSEFDYPSGEQNAYTSYEGQGGAEVGNFFWRTLWSIRLGNSKVLLTTDIEPDSRVMIHRAVMDRVKTIAPFLVLDRDPYMIIADGRLVWILDAYTTTTRFPYSQRIAGINYMRNPVKVTVDAYDGKVVFYEIDPTDPIVQAWGSAFPDLFTPISEMPESVRSHVRYPTDLFAVQAHIYATYHMTDPQMFYNREDQWEVPVVGGEQMEPYYTVMKLPGEDEVEFIQMLPFVPRNKPNLAAWMVARSDEEDYGSVLAYAFPKDEMRYGPNMIVARFNQDAEIAEKLSLWNQQGSNVHLGSLLVIPIEESLIYVQPLYLRAQNGSIPELRRVLVGYENRIAMEPTLDAALRTLFSETAAVATATEEETPADDEPVEPAQARTPAVDASAAAQARVHYEAAQAAARSGDWARYGEEIERLGEVLERLAAAPEAAQP